MPLPVVPQLSKLRKPSLTIPMPDSFAASALQTLGADSRTTGYWSQVRLHASARRIGRPE